MEKPLKMNGSLLETVKASQAGAHRSVKSTDEEIELALAWAKGEVGTKQICKVFEDMDGKKHWPQNVELWILKRLRQYIIDNS